MKGKYVRKLRSLRGLECKYSSPAIEILPDQNQVVFAGDPITLKCQAPNSATDRNVKLNWLWNSNITTDVLDLSSFNNPQISFNDISVENRELEDSGTLIR